MQNEQEFRGTCLQLPMARIYAERVSIPGKHKLSSIAGGDIEMPPALSNIEDALLGSLEKTVFAITSQYANSGNSQATAVSKLPYLSAAEVKWLFHQENAPFKFARILATSTVEPF